MAYQRVYKAFVLASSGTVTDATVFSELFQNAGYKGCVVVCHRETDAGNATMGVRLQGYHRISDEYYDVANAELVSYANDATGVRYAMVYPGATGSDADGSVLQDTNFSLVNGFLPDEFRIAVTHGGTSIANTFAVTVEPLN